MTQSWLTQTRRRHGMNRSRIGGEIRMTPDQDVGKAIHFAIVYFALAYFSLWRIKLIRVVQ